MKTIEALLSWAWVRNSQVPAFSAVYGGRVALVGRDYNSLKDEEGVKIFAAESFLFGEQMGWIIPHQYLTTCYREFYKKCVRAREAHKEFFYAGKLLRPLSIETVSYTHLDVYKRQAYRLCMVLSPLSPTSIPPIR